MSPDGHGAAGPTAVKVDLDERGYDILIGPGLIARAGDLMTSVLKQKRAFIVTDSNVAAHYLKPLIASLFPLRSSGRFMMSLCGVAARIDQMAAFGPRTAVMRSSVIVALRASTSAAGPVAAAGLLTSNVIGGPSSGHFHVIGSRCRW